jgi:hypothetical protein
LISADFMQIPDRGFPKTKPDFPLEREELQALRATRVRVIDPVPYEGPEIPAPR